MSAGSGTTPSIGTTMPGFVPHVTCGRSSDTSISSSRSKTASSSVGSARQRSTRRSHVRALRHARAALEIRERRLVGRDHSRARARLDRHVADRQASLHREAARSPGPRTRSRGRRRRRRRAARSRRARCPSPSTPSGQLALEADPQRARLALLQRLRREHVLDLGRADPERERAERAVRRRVRVAADDRHARAA